MSIDIKNDADVQKFVKNIYGYRTAVKTYSASSSTLSELKHDIFENKETPSKLLEQYKRAAEEFELQVDKAKNVLDNLDKKYEKAINKIKSTEPFTLNTIAHFSNEEMIAIASFNTNSLNALTETIVSRIREELPTYRGNMMLDDFAFCVDEIDTDPVVGIIGSSERRINEADFQTVAEYFAALIPNATSYLNATYTNFEKNDIVMQYGIIEVENGKVTKIEIDDSLV